MPFDLLTGKFIPEKSNIWRDCVDGFYDWVKEHILEVNSHGARKGRARMGIHVSQQDAGCRRCNRARPL